MGDEETSEEPRLILDHSPLSADDEDTLGRRPVARLLAKLITQASCRSEAGIIGLLGPWGSGKSSLKTLLESVLSSDEFSDFVPQVVAINLWTLPDQNVAHHLVIQLAEILESDDVLPGPEEESERISRRMRSKFFDRASVEAHASETEDTHPEASGFVSRSIATIKNEYASLVVLVTVVVGVFAVAIVVLANHLPGEADEALLPFSVGLFVSWLGASLIGKVFVDGVKTELKKTPEVNLALPAATTRSPRSTVKELEKISKQARKKTDRRLVVWLEDLDRCDAEQAAELLGLLSSTFNQVDVPFIVECDEHALASTLGTGGPDLIRKAFDHTVSLRPPQARRVSEFLEQQGAQEIELPPECLTTVKRIIGPHPRRLKRVLERLAQLYWLASDHATARIDWKVVALLEALRENWPSVWHWVDHDPARMRELLDDPDLLANQLNWSKSRRLMNALAYARGIKPDAWGPYFRLGTEPHKTDEVATGIESAIQYNDVIELERLLDQSEDKGSIEAFAKAFAEQHPSNSGDAGQHVLWFRAWFELQTEDELLTNKEILERAHASLNSDQFPAIWNALDPQQRISALVLIEKHGGSSLDSDLRVSVCREIAKNLTPRGQAGQYADLAKEQLLDEASGEVVAEQLLAWLGSQKDSGFAVPMILLKAAATPGANLRHAITPRILDELTTLTANDDEKTPFFNECWDSLAHIVPSFTDEKKKTLCSLAHRYSTEEDNATKRGVVDAFGKLPSDAFFRDGRTSVLELFLSVDNPPSPALARLVDRIPRDGIGRAIDLLRGSYPKSPKHLLNTLVAPWNVWPKTNSFRHPEMQDFVLELLEDAPSPNHHVIAALVYSWMDADRNPAVLTELFCTNDDSIDTERLKSLKALANKGLLPKPKMLEFRKQLFKKAKLWLERGGHSANHDYIALQTAVLAFPPDESDQEWAAKETAKRANVDATRDGFGPGQMNTFTNHAKGVGADTYLLALANLWMDRLSEQLEQDDPPTQEWARSLGALSSNLSSLESNQVNRLGCLWARALLHSNPDSDAANQLLRVAAKWSSHRYSRLFAECEEQLTNALASYRGTQSSGSFSELFEKVTDFVDVSADQDGSQQPGAKPPTDDR